MTKPNHDRYVKHEQYQLKDSRDWFFFLCDNISLFLFHVFSLSSSVFCLTSLLFFLVLVLTLALSSSCQLAIMVFSTAVTASPTSPDAGLAWSALGGGGGGTVFWPFLTGVAPPTAAAIVSSSRLLSSPSEGLSWPMLMERFSRRCISLSMFSFDDLEGKW